MEERVLTRSEFAQCRQGNFTPEIIKKLDDFQRKMVEPDHIDALNSLIPMAQKKARAAARNERGEIDKKLYGKVFSRIMNKLAEGAGLRRVQGDK